MPIISVRQFDYDTLKEKLRTDERIVILSCDGCARLSDGLGGEGGLSSLADRLLADGFTVVHRELLPFACSPEHLTGRLEEEPIRTLFEEADVIIPLSCDAGIERARETLPDIKVLRVTKTLGNGAFPADSGARLTEPLEGVDIEVDSPDGISLVEAAKRLGLYPGSF